jgi:predicted ATP-dependent endonuclease of OLD family
MSHIIEFSISELAGKKEIYSKQLNSDVNIFFGLNGSGKTSLLKILHSALLSDTEILRQVPFKQATVKAYSHEQSKEVTCTIEQIDDDKFKKEEMSLGEILNLTGDFLPDDLPDEVKMFISRHRRAKEMKWTVKPQKPKWRGLRHAYLPISRLYLTKMTKVSRLTEEQLDLLFARHVQELWTRYSMEILGTIRQAQEAGLSNVLKAILSPPENLPERKSEQQQNIDANTAYQQVTRFFERQKTSNILGSFAEFEKRYKNEPHIKSIVGDIDEVEKRIEQALKPRTNLENLIQQMFTDKVVHFGDQAIDIKTADGTELGLHTLSSGEKQLLLLLIETFLAGETCILIDEPEISMHIDWQEQLVEAMVQLNPKAQIIITTHSPEIMAKIDDEKIFRL